MPHHYEADDLVVRKLEVGSMENNVYVLECPETHDSFLVDGCFEAPRIIELARETNVVGILQTHGHHDHVQVLPELRAHFEVPVHAHPAESYPVAIDEELTDGQELSFGRRRLKVLHTPGHTSGSVCFLSGGHVISGDTLFPGGPGNTWGNPQAFEQIIESVRTKPDREFREPRVLQAGPALNRSCLTPSRRHRLPRRR